MSRTFTSLQLLNPQGLKIGTTNPLTVSAAGLTAPRMITFPDATDTLVARSTTDTLTNKTLIGTSNNIEANKIGQGSNAVSVSGTATAGFVLTATGANTASWQNMSTSIINSITTTNSTPTTIATIPTSDSTTYLVSADVVARRTDLGVESGGFQIKCTYRRQTGVVTLTQINSDDKLTFLDTGTWNVISTADVTGGNILIQVSGDAAKTINWKISAQFLSIS